MVRRSIRWPVLAISVVGLAALGLCLFLLHRWQVGRTASGLIALADAQEKEGNWGKSAQYLDRYLRLADDDSDARVRLALTFAKGATHPEDKGRAVELHYRALAAGLKDKELELRRGLAQLLVEAGRFQEAEKEAQGVLRHEPKDPAANRTLAVALANQFFDGSLAGQAIEKFGLLSRVREARELNPQDVELAILLATIYRRHPEIVRAENPELTEPAREQKATETLNLLVRDNPDAAPAWLARYHYRTAYGLEGAAVDLAQAVKLAPEDSAVLHTAAVDALQQATRVKQAGGEPAVVQELAERARVYFAKLAKLPPERLAWQTFLGWGDAWLLSSDIEQALRVWRDGLKIFAQTTVLVEFHARIAEACLEAGRLQEAREAIDSIDSLLAKVGASVTREQKLALTRANELRQARWRVQKGEYAAALPLLSQVVTSQTSTARDIPGTVQALWLMGNAYSAQGESRQAAMAYDEAIQLQPNLPSLRLAAATAWRAAGRPDLAGERAEAALNLAESPEAWLSLAVSQLQILTAQPKPQRSWRRFEEALAALDKVRGGLRESPWQVDLLRAEYLVQKDQDPAGPGGAHQAAALLQAAETRYAKEVNFWIQLSLAYQTLKLPADADRAIAQVRALGAAPAEAALAEARLANMRGEPKRAADILSQALALAPSNQQGPLRAELLRSALAAGDLAQARQLLLIEQKQNPNSLVPLRRLAEFDLEQRDYAQVKQWEQKMQAAGPLGQPLARYYAAWRAYLASKPRDSAALSASLRELEALVKAQPNWAEALALKALTEHRLERLDEAVLDYETAVQLGERRLFVFEHLIALFDQLNRPADVDRYLSRLATHAPLSQRLAEMASIQELRRDRPEQGLDIARRNVAARPTDVTAQLWLARLLMLNRLSEEAELAFLKATELAPANPQVWYALLAFYARADQSDKIKGVLARLEQNQELDPAQKDLLIGQTYEALGNREEAKRSYTLAATKGEKDLSARLRVAQFFLQSDPQLAKVHLEAALQIDNESLAARRMLAIVQAALGNLPAAEALLTSAGSGAAQAEEVRLNVLLLMQQGGQLNLSRAVGLMEDIVARPAKVQAVDRLLLSRLYEQQSQITDDAAAVQARRNLAEKELTALADSEEVDPAHLAALIQFLVRHGRNEAAATWLKRLARRVDDLPMPNPDAIALLVQMQVLTGAAGEAEPWLRKLEGAEVNTLRPVALRAQVACSLNGKADVEALIEPKAASLAAEAKTPADKLRLYTAIGDAYAALQRFAAAERWYRLLAAESPIQYPAVVTALARQGRIIEAIDVCQQASKTDPTAQPALVLATALVEAAATASDFERAEPTLAAALEKFHQDARLLYAVALVRVVQGRDTESIALFRRVVEINPRFVPALNNLAMLLAERPAGRDEALRLIDEALDIAGKDPGLLDTKGAILLYCGRSREAVPLLESATRESQADPRHHFHLAVAYRDQGKTEEAKAQLKTALDRKLGRQVLTPTDQKLLGDLRAALQL